MSDILLWLDVETTGLVPGHNHLLEIAAVVTFLDKELTPIGQPFSRTLPAPDDLRLSSIDISVLSMHSESGLWNDCRKSSLTLDRLWRELGSWGVQNDLASADMVMLAGRSVHFDREWLTYLMPQSELRYLHLSHKHFDLTSIKAFSNLLGLPFEAPADAHRALADINADLALARMLLMQGVPTR